MHQAQDSKSPRDDTEACSQLSKECSRLTEECSSLKEECKELKEALVINQNGYEV
jgi:hypothetical protein